MALSDRERKLLAEMEAALATDDPRLQSQLSGSTVVTRRPSLLVAALSILAGVIVLFSGLIAQITIVGVAGFLIALVGLSSLLRTFGAAPVAKVRSPRTRGAAASRLEERWKRRNL